MEKNIKMFALADKKTWNERYLKVPKFFCQSLIWPSIGDISSFLHGDSSIPECCLLQEGP